MKHFTYWRREKGNSSWEKKDSKGAVGALNVNLSPKEQIEKRAKGYTHCEYSLTDPTKKSLKVLL